MMVWRSGGGGKKVRRMKRQVLTYYAREFLGKKAWYESRMMPEKEAKARCLI